MKVSSQKGMAAYDKLISSKFLNNLDLFARVPGKHLQSHEAFLFLRHFEYEDFLLLCKSLRLSNFHPLTFMTNLHFAYRGNVSSHN